MAFNIRMALNLIKLSIIAYEPNTKRDVSQIKFRSAALSKKTRIDIHRHGKRYDTELFVAANSVGDVVVSFRGSETTLFTKQGEFRDWVLTDFDIKKSLILDCPSQRRTKPMFIAGFGAPMMLWRPI